MPWSRRTLALFFLGVLGFHGFFAHGYVENTDAEVTMHAARAFYLRGDPGLRAEGEDTWHFERALVQFARGQLAQPGRDTADYGMFGRDGNFYTWFPIGHQLLMVPCVALGELFAKWFPGAEESYRNVRGPLHGEFYWTRLFVSFLPVLCAAGSTLMVLLLVLALGCRPPEALLVTAVSTLCTQFWPGASETMSDGPGMFFLLAMAALVFRMRSGVGGMWSSFAAGLCGGWAVLVRYPHAVAVLVLTVIVLQMAWQRRSWRLVVAFALGAIPEAAVLLVSNWLRFESLSETGYSAGATALWWSYPVYLGIPVILLAPGKGLLWFSLPVWLVLPGLFRRNVLRYPMLPAVLIFLVPIVIYGHAAGWAAGQCWGIRYVTPSVVLLVAVGLACAKPWRHRPRLFAVVCGLGLLVSLGGVLTPYRGQQELAAKAAPFVYPEAVAGQIDNNINSAPVFSPIHTHWIYFYLSVTGRLERGGVDNTTGPMFGVYDVEEKDARVSYPSEDASMRHWWLVFLGYLMGVSLWPVIVAWGLVTAGTLTVAIRSMCRSPG